MARASRIGKVNLGSSYLQDVQAVDYSFITDQVDKAVEASNKKREEISGDIRTNLTNLQGELDKANQTAATTGDVVAQRAIQFSESASQKNLEFNRLYQQGKMSRDEFLIATNNVNRSAQNLNTFVSTIADYRKAAIEGQDKVINKATGLVERQKLDAFLSDQFEGFTNLTNHAIYMDDSGQAYFGKIDPKTGGISKNPTDIYSIASANTQAPRKYLNKDLDVYTTNLAKGLGAYVAANITGFETVEDALEKEGAKKYIENEWREFSFNDFNTLSVITNQGVTPPNPDQDWGFTFDKTEADKDANLILLEKNGKDGQEVAIVSDHKNFVSAKKGAKELFENQSRAKVARKETPKTKEKETAQETKENIAAKQRKFIVDNSELLMTAKTPAEWKSAADALKGQRIEGESGPNKDARVKNIKRTDNGIVVRAIIATTDEDGKTTTVDQDFEYEYTNKSPKQFTKGIANLISGGTLTQADIANLSTTPFEVSKLGDLNVESIKTIPVDYKELGKIINKKYDVDPDLSITPGTTTENIRQTVNQIGAEMASQLEGSGIDFGQPRYEAFDGYDQNNTINFRYKGTEYTIPFEVDVDYAPGDSNELNPESFGATELQTFLKKLWSVVSNNQEIKVQDFVDAGVPLARVGNIKEETEKGKTLLLPEDIIKRMMDSNPTATREQIVKALIDKGKLPKDYK